MAKKSYRKTANTDVRILPATIAVGAILLVLKAAGLAFGANAAETQATESQQTESPAPPDAGGAPKPVTLPDAETDPLAAINEALPNRPGKPLVEPPQTFTAGTLASASAEGGVSPAEMDVLTSLGQRRNALEDRQRELDLKANVITAAEKRVDDKIAQLKALQGAIEKLLGQRDAKETESFDGLVRIYTAMKPKDAARIFETLDNTVRLGVAGRMKPDTMAGIMSSLPPDVAKKMTVELAERYKMTPEVTAAAAAAAPAPTPPPSP